jgi:hypothetical protein
VYTADERPGKISAKDFPPAAVKNSRKIWQGALPPHIYPHEKAPRPMDRALMQDMLIDACLLFVIVYLWYHS